MSASGNKFVSKFSNLDFKLSSDVESKTKNTLRLFNFYISKNEKIDWVIDSLLDYDFHVLIYLCKNSPDLIEKFCLEDTRFLNAVTKKLQDATYSAETKSTDGTLTYSPLELYVAACLMNSFHERKESTKLAENLQLAARLGLYNAYLILEKSYEKILINQVKVIEDKKSSTEQIKHAKEKLESTIEKLVSLVQLLPYLYGALGYMQAGSICLMLAKSFETEDIDRNKTFTEQAVKNFLCASYLQDHAYSNEIIKHNTPNKTLLSAFSSDKKINNWSDAFTLFRDWTNNRFSAVEKEAKDEIDKAKKSFPKDSKSTTTINHR